MNYSVITICFNSAATLKNTIASVLAQTELPAEYIFVDGGSSDGTLEIIHQSITSARGRLPIAFRLIAQKDAGGITGAWNLGLEAASGDLVFILNSDDSYRPNTAKRVLAQFERSRGSGIVVGAGAYRQPGPAERSQIVQCRPWWILPFAMPIVHPACFVKRSVYSDIGPFDTAYRVAADYEFIYRARKAGVQFVVCDEVLVEVLTGGFSARNRELARRELLAIGQRHSCCPGLAAVSYALRRLTGR
jgi:glycosyltransferase involved in cell wall biosynthesis